jgi:hypothetical protein
MVKNLKDLIISGYLSLSKVEQQVFKDVLNNMDSDTLRQEEQVRKSEIKLISRKRFYEILDRADNFITQKDRERLAVLMEQRGFNDVEQTFTNKTYSTFEGGVDYKFKTDNAIFRFANSVHIKNHGKQKELTFFINTQEYPAIIANYHRLANLTYFEVTENRSKFAYTIQGFVGHHKSNAFEMALKFRGEVVINGEKRIYEDEEDRIMTKKDLIEKPNQYTLGEKDFID